MDSIIFNIGHFSIKWYSVIILFAFIVGYFISSRLRKKEEIPNTFFTDFIFYLVPVVIIGARVYYCIFSYKYYINNPLDVFKIWQGGLAIHGGIISGIIFLLYYCKKKSVDSLKLMDALAPALIIGQSIGRWGNFFNQVAFGSIVDRSFLSSIHIPNFIIDGMYINYRYHHPTFLYESIFCLIGFIIIMLFYKFLKRKDGQIVGLYFIIYGIIRFFIESLRTDSLMFFNLKAAQIISVIMIVIGIYLFIRSYMKKDSR